MGFSRGPKIITDGLVLALDAGSKKSYPSSGTTWYDLSGNANGNIANTAYNSDGYFSFDGTNDTISITQTIDLYAFDIWLYLNANVNSSTGQYGIFRYRDTALQSGFVLGNATGYINGDTLGFLYENPSANYYRTGITDTISAGWNNISVRWNGISYEIYVNGQSKTTTYGSSFGHVPLISSDLITIGEGYTSSSGDFIGRLGSFKVYERTLTVQEILQNYNATKSRFI